MRKLTWLVTAVAIPAVCFAVFSVCKCNYSTDFRDAPAGIYVDVTVAEISSGAKR